MEIWLVGRIIEGGWMCEGVFSAEHKAVSACLDYRGEGELFCVPADMDEMLPGKATHARLLWWPRLQTRQDAELRMQNARQGE